MSRPGSAGHRSDDAGFSGWSVLAVAALVTLTALLAYANSFNGPLVYDDGPSITANETIRHLRSLTAVLHPPAGAGVAGRPILNLSFALNHAISGDDVRSYHAVNLLIHVLAALTLFGVLRRTLRRVSSRTRAAAPALSLGATILWLVHPVQTAAVTYISQRAESLMALWYLLVLYGFIRAVEPVDAVSVSAPRTRNGWMLFSVVVCALGMATKEVMVTAPIAILLFDRMFVAESWTTLWRQRGRWHLAMMSTWAIVAWLMWDVSAHGRAYGGGGSWFAYAWTECRAVFGYLRLAVWPHPLVFDPGTRVGDDATLWHVVVLLAVLGGVVALLRRHPRAGFAAMWFFLILAPTSTVIPIIDQPMAENRVYLSLAGLCVLGVCSLHAVLGRRAWPAIVALATACVVLTARRNEDYRTEDRLWRDTFAKAPRNARAANNLGTALAAIPGRTDDEIEVYRSALRIEPNNVEAHVNLAGTLARIPDRFDEALEHFSAALKQEPSRGQTHFALGNALARAGRLDEARRAFADAVRLLPASAEVHYNFANALAQSGRPAEAVAEYEAAILLAPAAVPAHLNLGNLLAATGRLSDALPHFATAARLSPDLAEARFAFAEALAQSGRLSDGLEEFGAAVALDPENPDLRTSFGRALLAAGRAADAAAQFEAALHLRPDDPTARAGLAEAQRQTR